MSDDHEDRVHRMLDGSGDVSIQDVYSHLLLQVGDQGAADLKMAALRHEPDELREIEEEIIKERQL